MSAEVLYLSESVNSVEGVGHSPACLSYELGGRSSPPWWRESPAIVSTASDLNDPRDLRLLEFLQEGLPLVSRPYAELGRWTGLTEAEVIARLGQWTATGLIKRLGVVVRHRLLGYRANAMVVFDVPDERVAEAGRRLCGVACVTLSYRRPRRGKDWPYNLFCMIHGKNRATVETQVERLALATGLADLPRAVLFSRRCFKQRGALYLCTEQDPA